ncbi:hypothetical protein [Bifidobacterium biavatii]|nr:hypothetical protein [Bifidobacterium biavatii]
MSDYIETLLKSASMSDSQRAMLERAKENGGEVTASDYEQAWSDFRQCMVDRGYSEPGVVRYPNGLYYHASLDISGGTKEQGDKLFKDLSDCNSAYLINVDSVYRLQFGNPSLSSNSSEGAVDCLKRNDLAPANYTVAQFESDKDSIDTGGSAVVNFKDMQVRSCLIANSINLGFPDDPVWKPFG